MKWRLHLFISILVLSTAWVVAESPDDNPTLEQVSPEKSAEQQYGAFVTEGTDVFEFFPEGDWNLIDKFPSDCPSGTIMHIRGPEFFLLGSKRTFTDINGGVQINHDTEVDCKTTIRTRFTHGTLEQDFSQKCVGENEFKNINVHFIATLKKTSKNYLYFKVQSLVHAEDRFECYYRPQAQE